MSSPRTIEELITAEIDIESEPILIQDLVGSGGLGGLKISTSALTGTADAAFGVFVNTTTKQTRFYRVDSSGDWEEILSVSPE